MSQASNIKVTVEYAATVQRKQYEPTHYRATVEATLPDGLDEDEVKLELDALAITAKAHVLEQQGVPYEFNGTVLQFVKDGGAIVTGTAEAQPESAPAERPQRPAHVGKANSKSGKSRSWNDLEDDEKEEVAAQLMDSPGDFYDNRESKRSERSPDFKRKEDGLAIWLNSAQSDVPWLEV